VVVPPALTIRYRDGVGLDRSQAAATSQLADVEKRPVHPLARFNWRRRDLRELDEQAEECHVFTTPQTVQRFFGGVLESRLPETLCTRMPRPYRASW